MRNVRDYPLTAEDADRVLERQAQAISGSGRIGGIDGYALDRVRAFLRERDAEFRAFLAHQPRSDA